MGWRRDPRHAAVPSTIQRWTVTIKLIAVAPVVLVACVSALVGDEPAPSNPDLNQPPAERQAAAVAEVFGDPFRLGRELNEVRPLLLTVCDEINERLCEGAMAEPFERQVQVDCYGLEIFGAKRKVEFMFNDGPLGHIWILVDRQDLSNLESTLRRLFGPVVDRSERDLLFRSGGVVLRNDPPEILIGSSALVQDITGLSHRR